MEEKKTITVVDKIKQLDKRVKELEKELLILKTNTLTGNFADLATKVSDIEKKVGSIKKGDKVTFVVFSGEFDKAMAAFIMANGAIAMGAEVTMFFTFWGLNLLKKHKGRAKGKNLIEWGFDHMLPKGSRRTKSTHFNFGGMGPVIFRMLMKKNGVMSLEELIESAIDMGANIVTCEMTKLLLGIKDDDLIKPFESVGVGSYLQIAMDSQLNLFL